MPRAIARKGLISDHKEIRLTPYYPQVWVGRAGTLFGLGFGELAVADAYKARLLTTAFLHAPKSAFDPPPGKNSTLRKIFDAVLSRHPVLLGQEPRVIAGQVTALLTEMDKMAILLMAQGLLSIRACYDAERLLKEASKLYPGSSVFKNLLVMAKSGMKDLLAHFKAQKVDSIGIERGKKRGRIGHATYPWIVPEEYIRSNKAIKKAKANFEANSTNAAIGPRTLDPAEDGSLGVFAKRNIQKGERILSEKSMASTFDMKNDRSCSACCATLAETAITIDCCKARFCSQECKIESMNTHHRVLCGKDFTWLYEHCINADPITNEMIPLMMVKILAAAVQQNAKPLKVACVGTLVPGYGKETHSFFRLFENVIAPLKILQTLGVDVFTDVRFDSWAIQTLFLRIESNKAGHKLGKFTYSSISPLFSMINHHCDPAATWHLSNDLGGPVEVSAIRDIKEGEEITISYVEFWLPEAERRSRLQASIGKICDCSRCLQEREAALKGTGAFDLSALTGAMMAAAARSAKLR